jgi:hypothetical protein
MVVIGCFLEFGFGFWVWEFAACFDGRMDRAAFKGENPSC